MALTISNNGAVQAASYHLGKTARIPDESEKTILWKTNPWAKRRPRYFVGGDEGQGFHQPINRGTK